MLIPSPKCLGTFLTFFALILVFLTRRHAAGTSLGQRAMDNPYGPSDQTVIGGGMTQLQKTIVYDKLSRDTPSDIEANWVAISGAKTLLQKVRAFRDGIRASHNDESTTSVLQTLEDAKLELENLGKESFNRKKTSQCVHKLKVALKAAEEAIARGPDQKTLTSTPAGGDQAATQLEGALQEAEEDRKSKEMATSLEHLEEAELHAVIAESKQSPDFH